MRNPTKNAEDVEKRRKAFYENATETAHAIFKELVHCIDKGLVPASPKIQSITRKHHAFTDNIQHAIREVYKAMAQLYQKHPMFRKQLDSFHPKLAEFMSEGMVIFADRKIK